MKMDKKPISFRSDENQRMHKKAIWNIGLNQDFDENFINTAMYVKTLLLKKKTTIFFYPDIKCTTSTEYHVILHWTQVSKLHC